MNYSVNVNFFRLRKHRIEECLASILCFLLIYNISFTAFPQATTARLALIVGLLYAGLFRTSEFLRIFRRTKVVIFLFLPALYAIPLYMMSGDYGVIARFLNLYLYAVVGSTIIVSLMSNFERTLLIVFSCIVLQAFFIWLSFLSFGFQSFLDQNVVSSANFDVFYQYRASGLAGTSGAALSVIQALGVMVIWLYLRLDKNFSTLTLVFIFFGTLLVISSIIVVGRTGLFLAGIFLLFIFFNSGLSNFKKIMILIVAAGMAILGFSSLYKLIPDGFDLNWFWGWVTGAFVSNDTVEFLIANFPEFNSLLLVGSGQVSLVEGSNPSGSDSGYGQFFFAYGLPMGIFFYVAYIYTLLRITKYSSLFGRVILTLVFLFLDFKEPFLMKYAMFTILMILYLAYSKNSNGVSRLKF